VAGDIAEPEKVTFIFETEEAFAAATMAVGQGITKYCAGSK
jgi:hypothetical protein